MFGCGLYISLTLCFFISGNFPSVTQSVFVLDQIKRLLPSILVIDFLLTKIETLSYADRNSGQVSPLREGDTMALELRES